MGSSEVILPIVFAVCIMLLRVLIRCLLDASALERTKPERGHQLFRVFFIAPDLVILALALLVSTEVIKSILALHKIDTNLGEQYFRLFIILIVAFVAVLILCIILWLVRHDDERALYMRRAPETRRDRSGQEYEAVVWEIDWSKSYQKRGFKSLIVFANAAAVACVVAYAAFVIFGFAP